MRKLSLFRVMILLLLSILVLTSCLPAANTSTQPPSTTERVEPTRTAITEEFTETDLAPSTTETAAPSPTQVQPTATPIIETRLPPERWREWSVVPELTGREQAIYEHGISLGNDPTHFSKVGDCQAIKDVLMGIYDKPERYVLTAGQAYLQETIDNFAGSFDRDGQAVRGGYNAAAVLSPLWADPEACRPGETPIECEYRLHKPSIVIISLEVWWEGRTVERYEDYMRQIIEFYIDKGVVPILSTKADNVEGDHRINLATARLAYDYHIPLWNFWLAVQPMPNHGIDPDRDGFHISYDAWTVRSFTALQALDAVWRGVQGNGESEPEPTPSRTETEVSFAETILNPSPLVPPVPTEEELWIFSLVQRHDEDSRSTGVYAYSPSTTTLYQILTAGYSLEDVSLAGSRLLVSNGSQLYISDLAGNLQLLTEGLARTNRGASAFWLPDGSRLVCLTEAEEGDGRALWLVDPDAGDWERLADGEISGIIPPAGDNVIYWYRGTCDQDGVCGDNSIWQSAAGENSPFAEVNSAVFDNAGESYAWVAGTQGNTVILYTRHADQSAQDYLYLPGNRVVDFRWAPTDRRIAMLTVTRSEYTGKSSDVRIFIVDVEAMTQKEYIGFPGLNPGVHWDSSAQNLLLTSTLSTESGYQLFFRQLNLSSGLYDTLDDDIVIQSEDFITIDKLFWIFP